MEQVRFKRFYLKCVLGLINDIVLEKLMLFYKRHLKKIFEKLKIDIKYLCIAMILGLLIPQITSNKPNVSYINSITEKKEKVLEITENLQFDITNFTLFLIGTLFLLVYFQCKNQFRKDKIKKYMENIFLFLALTKIFLIFMNSRLSTLSELSIFKEYFDLIRTFPLYVLDKIYPFLMFYFLSVVFHLMRKEKKFENQEGPKKILYKSRESQRELLDNYLRDDDVSEILIDGKWGIGKTYFIETSIDENRPKIVVDLFLYNDRKKIIEIIIKELKKISFKESDFEVEKLEKYFDVFQNSMPFNLSSLFSKVESKKELKEYLKSIHLKEKSPIIIIENLDRILEKNIILEIIASLHELKDFLGIKIIVLGDLEILNHTLTKGCSDISHQEYLEKYLEKFFLRKLKLKEIDYIELIETELEPIMSTQSIENIVEILSEGKNILKEYSEKYSKEDTTHKDGILKIYTFVIKLEKILGNPRKVKMLRNEYKKIKLLHSDIFKFFKYKEERLFLILAIKEIEKNILTDLSPSLKTWEEARFYDFKVNHASFAKNTKGIFLGIFLALAKLSEIEIEFLIYLKEENELCFSENIKRTLFKSIETKAINLETAIKKIEMTRLLNVELGLDLYEKVIKNLFKYHFCWELEELNCQHLICLDQLLYEKRKKTLVFNLIENVSKLPIDTIKVPKVFLEELFLIYRKKIKDVFDKNYKIFIPNTTLNDGDIIATIKEFLYSVKVKKENLSDLKKGSYEWEEEYFVQLLKEDKSLGEKIENYIKHLLEVKKIEDAIVNRKTIKVDLNKYDTEQKLELIFEGQIAKLTECLKLECRDPIYEKMFNLNLYRKEIQKIFKEANISEQNKQELKYFKSIMLLYYYIRNQIEKNRKELNVLEKYLEKESTELLKKSHISFKTEIINKKLSPQYSWYIEDSDKKKQSFLNYQNFFGKINIEKWIENNDEFFLREDWNTIKNFYNEKNFKGIFDNYIELWEEEKENQREIALKTYENYVEIKDKLKENNFC